MKRLIATVVLLAVALPACAGWGVPWIMRLDPGDGPGPPRPDDPGDGPIVFDEPIPVPDWGAFWLRVVAQIGYDAEIAPWAN